MHNGSTNSLFDFEEVAQLRLLVRSWAERLKTRMMMRVVRPPDLHTLYSGESLVSGTRRLCQASSLYITAIGRA
jgi:hypothetical protein